MRRELLGCRARLDFLCQACYSHACPVFIYDTTGIVHGVSPPQALHTVQHPRGQHMGDRPNQCAQAGNEQAEGSSRWANGREMQARRAKTSQGTAIPSLLPSGCPLLPPPPGSSPIRNQRAGLQGSQVLHHPGQPHRGVSGLCLTSK